MAATAHVVARVPTLIATRDPNVPGSFILNIYKVHPDFNKIEDLPLVEFMYLVFTLMPGESYRRRLRLYLCYVFRALINSLVCLFLIIFNSCFSNV